MPGRARSEDRLTAVTWFLSARPMRFRRGFTRGASISAVTGRIPPCMRPRRLPSRSDRARAPARRRGGRPPAARAPCRSRARRRGACKDCRPPGSSRSPPWKDRARRPRGPWDRRSPRQASPGMVAMGSAPVSAAMTRSAASRMAANLRMGTSAGRSVGRPMDSATGLSPGPHVISTLASCFSRRRSTSLLNFSAGQRLISPKRLTAG